MQFFTFSGLFTAKDRVDTKFSESFWRRRNLLRCTCSEQVDKILNFRLKFSPMSLRSVEVSAVTIPVLHFPTKVSAILKRVYPK